MTKHQKKGARVYVEGAGDRNAQLDAVAREAFRHLFADVVPPGSNPKFVFCGDRKRAYEKFEEHLASKRPEAALLLVDTESLFAGGPRWEHVLRRKEDKWSRPTAASEDHLRFMAVVMETWCIADPDSVRGAWKLTGHEVAPPQRPEGIAKVEVYKRLSTLTRGRWTEKTKGLSFELVRALNPRTLQARCPEFKALCDRLRELSSEQSS